MYLRGVKEITSFRDLRPKLEFVWHAPYLKGGRVTGARRTELKTEEHVDMFTSHCTPIDTMTIMMIAHTIWQYMTALREHIRTCI